MNMLRGTNIFGRGSRRRSDRSTDLHALETTDVLLSIVPHLDIVTLLNLRLVRKSLNQIVLNHQPWICNTVARYQYGWVFNCAGRAHRETDPVPWPLRKFTNLARLKRLHISSILATLLLWSEPKTSDGKHILVVPSLDHASSCARGFLMLWDLADVEHGMNDIGPFRVPCAEYLISLDRSPSPGPRSGAQTRLSRVQEAHVRVREFRRVLASFRRRTVGMLRERMIKSDNRSTHGSIWSSADSEGFQFETRKAAEAGLAQKLVYAKSLDQGAWADIQVATAAILAFCNLEMSNMMKDGDYGSLDHDSLKQAIEWLVRQGPDLLLGMLSQQPTNRRLARRYILDNWITLPATDRVWQSELYGNSWGADEARPEYDFRALLLWNGVFYRHSRQEEWNQAGYPTLWDCVIDTLRGWDFYDLTEEPDAIPIANRLRAFKGKYKRPAHRFNN